MKNIYIKFIEIQISVYLTATLFAPRNLRDSKIKRPPPIITIHLFNFKKNSGKFTNCKPTLRRYNPKIAYKTKINVLPFPLAINKIKKAHLNILLITKISFIRSHSLMVEHVLDVDRAAVRFCMGPYNCSIKYKII